MAYLTSAARGLYRLQRLMSPGLILVVGDPDVEAISKLQMPPSTPNAVLGAVLSRRVKVNAKVLRAGGFASGEECLDIHATLAHHRTLEAHILRTNGRQGKEPYLKSFCRFETR